MAGVKCNQILPHDEKGAAIARTRSLYAYALAYVADKRSRLFANQAAAPTETKAPYFARGPGVTRREMAGCDKPPKGLLLASRPRSGAALDTVCCCHAAAGCGPPRR